MKLFIKILLSPLRLIFFLISLPFKLLKLLFSPISNWINNSKFGKFFSDVPDDRPVMEAASEVFKSPSIFFDQIEDFRKHLLRSLLFLVVSILFSFTFTDQIIAFIAQPVGGLASLQAIEVTESLGVFMKVALLLGVAFALPYITFEIWLFIAPGLMPRSRKVSLITIPFALLFFVSGLAFAYYFLLPSTLPFLLDFMGVSTKLRPQSYFDFVTGIMFWIGVSFEFPLVIFGISSMGWIKPSMLLKQWRMAVVVISVIAAVITPTVDPVNMALVMAPMTGLYFISILFSWVANMAIKTDSTV